MACPLHCQGQGTCFGLPHSRPAFLQDLFQQFIQHPMMLIAASWSCRLERPKAVALMGWPWSARAHGCGVEGRERGRQQRTDSVDGDLWSVPVPNRRLSACPAPDGWVGSGELSSGREQTKSQVFFLLRTNLHFFRACFLLLSSENEGECISRSIHRYPCLVPVGWM